MTPLVSLPQSDVPLPLNATDAMPEMTDFEEIQMRGRTVKLIADLTDTPIEPTEEHRDQAVQLANEVITNPETQLNLNQYPNETMAYLAGMVSMYQADLVKELADYKRFVVNKLVKECDHPDAKIRLGAIKALGEVDGVDAFKKRSEITHKQQSMEEVEKELLDTLERLEKRTINVQSRVIPNDSDAIDA
jgi:hypothetical protein